jgi:hypothetical protein
MLLVATLALVHAVPILEGRSVDPKTVQSALNNTGRKAGSIAGVNTTRGRSIKRQILFLPNKRVTFYNLEI